MATLGILVGGDAAAYFNTNLAIKLDPDIGQDAAWWLSDSGTQEATNLMDANDNIGSEMADNTTRAEARLGWAAELAIINSGQVTFDFRWEPADLFVQNLIGAWDGREAITLAFFDQVITSGALSFTGGNTAQPGLGDTITGTTSAATAVVTSVGVESGSFAGGNAAGIFTFANKNGSFQPGEPLTWSGGSATVDAVAGAQGLIANFSVSLTKSSAIRDIQKGSATVSVAKWPEWYEVP